MKLIISGLGLIICTVALIYMIVKKPNSKQRNAEISKNTLQLIPERDYDDELEAFIVDKDMTGYQYMDLIEIKSQDLQNLSDDEVYFNMAKFSRCFKRYDADIKIIALNFPSDMSKQKAFYSKKRENTKNARYQRWIDRKLEQLEDPRGGYYGYTPTGGNFVWDMFYKTKIRSYYNSLVVGTMEIGRAHV